MPVIDVDCHFDIALQPDDHPLREWSDRIPGIDRFLADAVTGDLGRHTPDGSRPDENILAMFLPDENRSAAEQVINPGEFTSRFPSGAPDERVGWFDEVGIDYALMKPRRLGFPGRLHG